MPLVEERSGDEAEESGLYLGDGRGEAVAEQRDRHSEAPLQVALAVELLAHLQAPGPAHFPRSARVANVGALERDLQHKVAVLALAQVQRAPVHRLL